MQLLVFRALETLTLNPDPRTALAETEVQKILHLQALADKIPDGFDFGPRILRNPIPGTGNQKPPVLPKMRAAKPRTRAAKSQRLGPETMHTHHQSDQDPGLQIAETAEAFITRLISLDSEPTSLEEAKTSPEWPQWHRAIEAEYNSLRKRQVFGPLATNLTTKPIGHKLVFTRKRNEKGEIIRYKVRLVAQGFNQRPGVDFEQTYSLVMDSSSFRYLLGLAVQLTLETRFLDVITAYLYDELDADIHIRPPPDFLDHIPTTQPGKYSGLKLRKALYELKQAGRMWYHHLRSFLLANGFTCHPALPCVFVLRKDKGFVILAAYVDDLNLVGTPGTCIQVEGLLTTKFEMKLLGKTTFCLGL